MYTWNVAIYAYQSCLQVYTTMKYMHVEKHSKIVNLHYMYKTNVNKVNVIA